jgi:hypothetical protein
MSSLPEFLVTPPTTEDVAEALKLWKEYRMIYRNGQFLGWKLKYKKQKKDCGCN